MFHWFWDGFWSNCWCFFDTFYRSHMQPSKTSKTLGFTLNFNDFTIQRNMIFDDFPDLFRYQFWHWFLMTFGIDFGSILGPLWHQIPCFLVIVFLMVFWIGFWPKWFQKIYGASLPFRLCFASFFRTLVPFTSVRPTSARNQNYLSFFFKYLKEYIHTCTFYKSKTYKCAATVFTILKKKLNVKNLKVRSLQGMILELLLRRLAPFCPPFGSIRVVLVPFGSLPRDASAT